MRPKERMVHFYDLVMESYTGKPGQNPSCSSIKDVLDKIKPKGHEVLSTRTVSLEVSDWRYDASADLFYLLLNRADRNVSDVGFKDFSTKTRRKANKTKQEGIESSCHVIIKPEPNSPKALLLMTMGSGVTFQAIEKFLRLFTRLLKAQNKNKSLFTFPDPSGAEDDQGNPLTYSVNYKFNCFAHKSVLLDQVLKAGTFQSMDLIAHENKRFDSSGNLEVTKQSIYVVASPQKSISAAVIKNSLSGFIKTKDGKDFTGVTIRYMGTDGSPKSNTFDIKNLDEAFTKRENVELAFEVDAQQLILDNTILTAMKKLL